MDKEARAALIKKTISILRKELRDVWDSIPDTDKRKAATVASRLVGISIRDLRGEDTKESRQLATFALGVIKQIGKRRAREAVKKTLLKIAGAAAGVLIGI